MAFRRYFPSIPLAAVLLAAAGPAAAQLVIGGPAPYPTPPKLEADEKKEAPPPPPTYSGDPIAVPVDCDAGRLHTVGLFCVAATPCEIFAEWTAAAKAGEALIVAGGFYGSAAPVESAVLRSEDGGATWMEAAERILGAALDEMSFVDANHGWIVGRQSVGGGWRPFLLATTDGGASWARRAIDPDEDNSGMVAELRFDSPEHGYAILERPAGADDPYELYETYNGGRSWSIRQIAAARPAIPGSRRRPLEAAARIGEGAKGATAVEVREGGGWRVAARFSERAGVCGHE